MSYVVAGTVLRAWQHTEVLFMHWAAKIWFVVWAIIGFVIAGLMIYLPVVITSYSIHYTKLYEDMKVQLIIYVKF